ncbi:hypothetical protein scyTo_0016422, partial [Scyliorhinus torazame]|nr:hypothetical protein [Scyliorhinus torazame]
MPDRYRAADRSEGLQSGSEAAKFLVCVALLLLAVRYGESSCYRAPQQGIYKITKTCRDDVDGTWHADGESWKNSDCMRCECMPGLMECCTT